MSRWTHVAGLIRYDCCYYKDEKIKELLGKQYLWGDTVGMTTEEYNAYWEERERVHNSGEICVPYGSEGSLEYEISHKNVYVEPDGHVPCCADTTVSIWGDLRDFGGPEDIEKIRLWFEKITCSKEAPSMVRSAVLQVEDEWSSEPIIMYFKSKWKDGEEVNRIVVKRPRKPRKNN